MFDYNDIIASNGYLVYRSTGEKVIWYQCDPNKNCECNKSICRVGTDEDHNIGFCDKTNNPAYRKDGSKAWYAVLKCDGEGEPYWGREYIEGV